MSQAADTAPRRAESADAAGLVIPRATYRLQLSAAFTFRDATAIVPYLASLGISHVYCSPYFRARAGSTHGYDVVDHNSFNPEIGDRADFEQFVAMLRSHGMGHIVDIVPNHVGIGPDNAWWMDVLENGEASVYAAFFDIDWSPPNPDRAHKVLVPMLAAPYGAVLERGELELRFEPQWGSFAVHYQGHRLPLDPRTYPRILDRVVALLASSELENLRRALAALPDRHSLAPEQVAERNREKELHKRRLAALAAANEAVTPAIEAAVRSFLGTEGEPASFDALHELLELQAYHLASWRVAAEDINYRRFFDINDLAALRVENEAVFEATHRLLLQLIAEGRIDGLRIDHADGLYDPAGYFRRLQQRIAELTGRNGTRALYLVAEKITASFEHLPADWPVHGETGYHFANVVNRLLVDSATRTRMDRAYRQFIDEPLEWREVAYQCQQLVLRRSLASELNVATNLLAQLARADRSTRDFTFNTLRTALAEVIACFPVYRTYVAATVADSDRRYIEWAIAAARRRRAAIEASVFDFVRSTLLLELPAPSDELRRRMRAFVMRFQQITAPITAKGVEDTAFYRFNRLLSLNEVGGEPGSYGAAVRAFHADAEYRARNWPHEMLATSTHDTKRSEDVRARLSVLSEMTTPWREAVRRWSRFNRTRKRELEGLPAPSPQDEYHFYQTLVGSWPPGEPDLSGAAYGAYRERVEAYMIKAAREAKQRTSWTETDAAYEEALTQFVRIALEPRNGSNLFLADFMEFVRRVTRYGLLNALTQTLCKLTVPGVPDIYQGNEIWEFSLVDPDNRRPVDYNRRRALLAEVISGAVTPRTAVADLEDGRAKLLLTWKCLELRRAHPELFRDGAYRRLRVRGLRAHYVCAFARRLRQRSLIVIAPRLYRRLLGDGAPLPLGEAVWGDTLIELPREDRSREYLRNVLDGARLEPQRQGESVGVPVAQALAGFPVAVLAAGCDEDAGSIPPTWQPGVG
ncbi:MAG TPA: malto-oligosyltrehalose synthase [Steroidobacteraceae bacterium]|nr:malto-oligosyltrehalose synthase [Steroidobacteraceae bacterium]